MISWTSIMNIYILYYFVCVNSRWYGQPSRETSTDASATVVSPLDTLHPQAPSKQKQLSDFEKGKIVFAYEQGWSYQRIADYMGWYTKY